jgi:hypothetical protein
LRDNQDKALRSFAEGDPVAGALSDYIAMRAWRTLSGDGMTMGYKEPKEPYTLVVTPKELFGDLERVARLQGIRNSLLWPKSAQALSQRLTGRLGKALKVTGIEISRSRTKHDRTITITAELRAIKDRPTALISTWFDGPNKWLAEPMQQAG